MYGWYINLDSRTDRKQHMEDNILHIPFFSKLQRFSAIQHSQGGIGCTLSHITILEKFLETNESMLLLLEDDFIILHPSKFESFVSSFEHIKDENWDIIVLTPKGESIIGTESMQHNGFKRICNNQTTTGYIVKREFAKKLLENFKEGLQHLQAGDSYSIYALDQFWKNLQHDYHFYYYTEVYAGQLEGFSTIENRHVNYNHAFMNQK